MPSYLVQARALEPEPWLVSTPITSVSFVTSSSFSGTCGSWFSFRRKKSHIFEKNARVIVPFAGNEVPLLVSRALPAPVPLPLSTLKVVSSRNNNNNPVVVIKNRFPRKTMQSVEMMEKKRHNANFSPCKISFAPVG